MKSALFFIGLLGLLHVAVAQNKQQVRNAEVEKKRDREELENNEDTNRGKRGFIGTPLAVPTGPLTPVIRDFGVAANNVLQSPLVAKAIAPITPFLAATSVTPVLVQNQKVIATPLFAPAQKLLAAPVPPLFTPAQRVFTSAIAGLTPQKIVAASAPQFVAPAVAPFYPRLVQTSPILAKTVSNVPAFSYAPSVHAVAPGFRSYPFSTYPTVPFSAPLVTKASLPYAYSYFS